MIWSLVVSFSLVAALAVAQAQQQLYLITNNLCLTLGQDRLTVVVAACGQFAYQQWDISGGDKITIAGYCLDAFPGPAGALQIKPCSGALSQSWWFGQDGKVTNKAQTSGCLSTQGANGATLVLAACGSTVSQFYSSSVPPVAQSPLPPVMQQPPVSTLPQYQPTQQQPPVSTLPQYQPTQQQPLLPPQYQPIQQQQPPPLSLPQYQPVQQQPPPPPAFQVPTVFTQPQVPPPPPEPVTVSQQIQQHQQQPIPVDLSQDHYLCTCIVDASADACATAVKAACTIGHLDASSCRKSFSKGDHDHIADEILKAIENGAKCSRFDPAQLKREAQQRPAVLPASAFSASGEGVPTAEDHYLCACLDSKSSDKCLSAVKAACLVGHIPSGDCQASLSGNSHEAITDHILRLIDSGASCSQKLREIDLSTSATKPQRTGMVSRVFPSSKPKREITADQRDLCACLDDPESAMCGAAIKRACSEKRIPAEDCAVAANKHYMGGVTKHALRLIDHGAQCPAHRSMTFTNHGCHCLQSWSEGGKTFSFPDNCADPGGKKGFGWCKTFASEHCAGVEGSTEWDRCDAPRVPVRRDEVEVDGSGASADGQLGAEDHYLCICLAQTSTDEVCVAAVKAACAVGHLPQAACRASFESKEHSAVSDMVVQLLQGGAKCTETVEENKNVYKPKPGESKCPDGFIGFPACRRKVECTKKCGHGQECDHLDGTCQCLPTFTGPHCSQCVEGYSGRNCTPDGKSGGWTLGQGLVYLFLFGGLIYAGFTAFKKFGGQTSMGITYAKLPGAQGPAEDDLEHSGSLGGPLPAHGGGEDDGVAMASDLGSDIEAQSTSSSSSKPKAKQEYSGLAV